MKIYVGNLPYETEEGDLEQLFSQAGELSSVNIIRDRDTGRSKGFGFVEFQESSSVEAAISKFDNYDFNGRNIKVSEAREKAPRRGGGGGGGGNHRRGGGGGGRY